MSFGEMTITLDDISCLIGSLVIGKFVCQPEGIDVCVAADLVTYSLGVSYSEDLMRSMQKVAHQSVLFGKESIFVM